MSYWVYENDPTNKAMVHEDSCGFCNYGEGVRGGSLDNGRWHGPFESGEEASAKAGPQDVPTFEDANSVHLLGNMKEGGLNNPPLSPRLCATTHPAPVLKFLARVNA